MQRISLVLFLIFLTGCPKKPVTPIDPNEIWKNPKDPVVKFGPFEVCNPDGSGGCIKAKP